MSIDSREGSCEQSECASDTECCVKLTSNCVSRQSNKQGRANYFHLTISEHVCQNCYDEMARQLVIFNSIFTIKTITFSGRPTNDKYVVWKGRWMNESRCSPNLRIFTLDALLPFWVSCNNCGKFRKTSSDENQWTTENIAEFTCDQNNNNSENTCDVEEDKVNI